jgi:polyisoprenoid-binding protein YceI
MNTRQLTMVVTAALSLATAQALRAEDWAKYEAKPGSKVQIDGTSNIHDWRVTGSIIGGYVEVGKDFPTDASKTDAKPGKVEARAQVSIPIRSLRSVNHDGTPYNTKMDEIMQGKLKMEEHKNITFKLHELVLKEAPKKAGDPFLFQAVGEIGAAGESKKVEMPVSLTFPAADKMKFDCEVSVKMTDFKIEPPAPAIAGGAIKTGDEIKLSLSMMTQKKAAAK